MPIEDTIRLLIGLTVDGLGQGLLFAMLGLGITLVFGLGGVLNLSIGMFSVLTVLLSIWALEFVPSIWVAMLLGIFAVTLLSYLVDQIVLPIVYRSEGDERMLLGIFGTLGLAIFLEGLAVLRFPSGYTLPVDFAPISVEGIFIRASSLVIIAVATVTTVVLYLFFERTYLGQAARTLMQDETGTVLCGIDARKLRTQIFVLSTVIAAITGLLWSLGTAVSGATSLRLAIYGVMVSIAGGVTSLSGTFVAGLALGLISTYVASFMGSYWSNVAIFGVVIAILLIKPGRVS